MRVALLLVCFPLLAAMATTAGGQTLIPREHHEWGRFPVGSWKKVRLVTEQLAPDGRVIASNSSVITTTVTAVDDSAVQLQVATVVELAGKEFPKEPQVVTQGFEGEVEPANDNSHRLVKHLGREKIEIDGQAVESEVSTVTVRRDTSRWTSRINYCRDLAPYILRREITAQDLEAGVTRYETTVEVTAVNTPREINGQTRLTSQIRTVHTTNKGKTTTLEVRCEDVPGGFVSHASNRMDSSGRVVERSTLELVDFNVPETKSAPPTVRTTPSYGGGWQRYYYRSWRTN